ncbi:repetitive surface protein Esp [Enterococcus faecium]|uniref:YSIRK-type signal peptide-containing protein n=1 Tax=Enterococcus faecium TaxID=1352 RepID=A0A7V7Y5U9_ENTFC|nr:repetitive surface protein Esp [Enterococcus faecium]VTQ88654.1 Enterococcal surface protein [Enterococcus hirae]AON59767.1 YSIRK signal domain/LPXTG anchor domain surface protein [Enterococcus faecium]KAB7577700.1 YSIRK-type signal peptide-containing protein [Enterococcus faecium]KAB7590485.1 YSIRK-type signal peptide-containing protein [Enterococcus faecium]KAB7594295.1 YSIRK-type signal peptide-containing protein [Enterococcus faecium]
MVSKNNKRVFLEKTKKRVLKYSIKKLSVGVASVLIGVGLVLGTTELVKAQDEISPSSPLETAISSVQVGDKVASGNTFQENPGYTKNYNFSDLQFSPQELTGDTLKGNTIGFEVYGKHNIAASTKNWEIRLQLDERLAKYVEKIQVDPKKGIGSSRRTFVRINDSLGRPTNIWKVNYIRASDGLFAGAETTDTQTAPNGVITFEKSLDEIFKEIGIDNLKTDRLMYRIYLVSHQDDDKIVPGIDSTGYFLTDSDDFYNSLDVSENNPDQFKHGSVSAKYEKPNTQTKDGSGSTGANGAIILDHKLTKNYNFSYSSSAKGTPWYANYKIDERLVPYVAGIQMHMVQADKVTYDVSFESGTKVADLAIERREGHENYGIGSITNNDLTKLIDFANASPRPVVIRYVLQLTKPLDEILEDMKATAQVEENKPFGEDFIFDSWLSDTNKKLIQNTYGTGYYYLQDIDGDGNPDDKEESGDTNPYIGKPELEEVYDVDTTVKGKVFIHELAGTGHKAQLVDKEGTVLAEKTIAPNEKDGAPISDTVEFEFTGVDSSKLIAKDELKIQIVSPGFDKPEEGSTVIKESPKAVDKQTVVVGFKPDAKESIRNNKNLPEDAEYSWKTEPDTSNVTDSTKGIVTVKIGNRTFDVDVEFAVKASQAMENDATYVPITTTPETTVQSGKPTFDKPDVPLAKDAFSISDVYNKDFGNASVDANTGIVTFTPAKGVGESEPITGTIPIKIVYQDGSVGTTDLAVTVSKDIYENPGENIPAGYHKVTFTAGEGTSIESGTTVFAVKDGVSLPEDKLPVLKAKDGYTDAKWPEEATQPITADDTEFVSSATKLDDIIENPGDNIPAGYHKVTFTAGEGTSIESGTTVFAVKDGVSLPEDKLPVLKAKDGYTDAKWPEEATQPITADDTEFVSSATKLDDIIENPGDNIPAGYHKVTFTAGEGTSIESGTTVFAVKDGVSLPEDKLPVLKAKDGYTDAKWPEEATQPITADDTEFVSSATKLDDIIENPGENIPAGYHKVTFTAGEGTSIESGTTVFAVKDGVSLPEDKLPVLKAKDGYTDAKWPEEATQPITADDTEFVSSATKLDDIIENPGDNIPAGYHKVTFTAGEGTSIESGTTVFAVKDGVSLPEDKLPVLKAKDGYTDAKWPEEATQPITADDTEFVSSATKLDDIIENPGENIPAGYHKVTFTAGEGTSIESGTTVFAVKDGVSLPEDKLPVLKAKDGYTDAKWPEEATQPITADDTEFVSSATKLDDKSDADKYNPEGQKVTTELNKEPDAFEGIKNKEDLPKDTKYTWKEKVDVSAAGNKKGTVVVTYPDGSSDEVEVDVTVTDNRSDADKYEPTVEGEKVEVGGTVDLTDNVTNLPTLPEGTTVTDVTPGGTIDTNTPGNYEGVIEVTYPDGTKDTVKVPVEVTDNRSDADKYEPTVEGEKVEVGGTVDLTDNVTNLPTLPEGTTVTDVTPGGTIDTNTPGNYEGVIEVTYPDGTKDTVKVPVEVTDNRSDADKYTPMVEGEKVEVGGTVDLTDNVTNLPTLPEGTTVTDVTPGGTIDTNTPGNYEGVIEVTYPDGTKDTVKVPVEVTDNRSDADKYTPMVEGEKVEVGGTVDLTDNVTNLPTLPEGTTVTDVTPGGTIDTNTPGNYEGVIEVTYPDGTKDTVKVPVEVTDNRSDADKYEPTVEGEKVEVGGTVDLTDNVTNLPALPEGTTVTDVTPGGTIDTNTPGNYEGVIEVTYPDGTKDTVKVPVEVTDNRSDADKYEPTVEGEKVEIGGTVDLTDNVTNLPALPEGTTVTDVTPGGTIDTNTPGNYEGVIEVTYPDGTKDTVKVPVEVTDNRSNADKYNPEGQKVTTDLNKEPDASEGIKNKEDLPKGTTYAWKEKVDVSTAGNKKGTIVVTYPDGSSDEVEVDVTVTDTRSDADKYNPEGQKVTTDLNKEPDASEGIKNKEDLPKGTTYTWKEKVDVSTAGNKKGTVVVTYPDGSKEEVEVTISVVDKKAPNKPQVDPITEGDQIVTGKTEPNAEVTVTLPDGSQHHGTADKNGNFTVKVPKLEAGTKVIVTATDESGNTSEPTNVVVSSNKKDSGKNGSKGSKTDNQGSNSNQDKNRGKSQSSKVFPKTGESDSNIFTISGGLILLGTLGLLGYKNRKKENE